MKHHLRVKGFRTDVLDASHEWFGKRSDGGSRPWYGTQEEQFAKAQKWADRCADAYGVPRVPVVLADPIECMLYGCYDHQNGRILMPKLSVMTAIHEFRHHLQVEMGEHIQLPARQPEVFRHREEDAIAWSTSLFYRIRPTLFRKRVREGRILFIAPEDLLAEGSTWTPPEGAPEWHPEAHPEASDDYDELESLPAAQVFEIVVGRPPTEAELEVFNAAQAVGLDAPTADGTDEEDAADDDGSEDSEGREAEG